MKICVVQTKPVKGDIQANIANHKKLIELAVSYGANIVVFPELSLTGYEPELSKELATEPGDSRFNDFQNLSDSKHITIGVGMPVKSNSDVLISMLIFQPGKPRQIYSKQYLHPDELPYFINGQHQVILTESRKISFAICYELSVAEHSANAYKGGTEIYIASVAKSVSSVEKAVETLAGIANKYSMIVLMSNCIGLCDGVECGGKTSIWNSKGLLAGQLNASNEGILIIDTETQELIEKII